MICYLLAGGRAYHSKQKYYVIYRGGKFIIESTGTLVGDFNNLETIEKEK